VLNLIVALPAEARPLLSHFSLQQQQAPEPFRLYVGENMRLLLSGVGKNAAATAVEHLLTCFPETATWLNLGIAGHSHLPVGTPLLANRITDAETGKIWLPIFSFDPPCAISELITVDQPEDQYPEPCAYDMEASGFFQATRNHAPADRVHCLKIVSDTPDAPHQRISGKMIGELIADHLHLIDELVATLNSSPSNSTGQSWTQSLEKTFPEWEGQEDDDL
jgi:adenosylhomocysteine nucleosidase